MRILHHCGYFLISIDIHACQLLLHFIFFLLPVMTTPRDECQQSYRVVLRELMRTQQRSYIVFGELEHTLMCARGSASTYTDIRQTLTPAAVGRIATCSSTPKDERQATQQILHHRYTLIAELSALLTYQHWFGYQLDRLSAAMRRACSR